MLDVNGNVVRVQDVLGRVFNRIYDPTAILFQRQTERAR